MYILFLKKKSPRKWCILEKKKVLTIPSVSNFNSFLAFQIYSKIYIFPHSKITARLVFQGIKLFKMWLEYLAKKIDFKTTECIIILRQIEYLAKPKQYIILDVGATNIIVAEDRSMLCIGCSGCTHQQCRRKVTKFEHARHTTEEIIGTSGSFPFSPSHSSRSQLALSKKSDYITHQWYSFFNQHQWYSWT